MRMLNTISGLHILVVTIIRYGDVTNHYGSNHWQFDGWFDGLFTLTAHHKAAHYWTFSITDKQQQSGNVSMS